MKTKKRDYIEYIENNTIRIDASHRGGGIEIDVSELLHDGDKISAYQNYLGGGMLGSIQSSYNFDTKKLSKSKYTIYLNLSNALKKYFHDLTNHNEDEYESSSYYENQKRAVSAY